MIALSAGRARRDCFQDGDCRIIGDDLEQRDPGAGFEVEVVSIVDR